MKKGKERRKKEREEEKKRGRILGWLRLSGTSWSHLARAGSRPAPGKNGKIGKERNLPTIIKMLWERERNSMSPTEEMESWSINKVGMLSQGCAGLPGDAQHPRDGKQERRI